MIKAKDLEIIMDVLINEGIIPIDNAEPPHHVFVDMLSEINVKLKKNGGKG